MAMPRSMSKTSRSIASLSAFAAAAVLHRNQPTAILSGSGRSNKFCGNPSRSRFKISNTLRNPQRYRVESVMFSGAIYHGVTVMLRKTIIALFAVASIGVLAPGVASARGGGGGGGGGGGHGGGFGGGGFHGGGFGGGGFHGGGFRGGRGFGLGGIGLGLGLGYGLYGPYGYYGDYGYPYYAYGDSYYDDGGCYVVRRRVHTPYGWRIQPVQVCG
jgi:hypothetical protein